MSTSADENTVPDGTSSFVAALVVNAGIGFLLLILFSFLRRKVPWCYDARRVDTIRNPNYRSGDAYLEPPPRQEKGFFAWVPQTLRMTDEQILHTSGVDALVTIRFFFYMFLYFGAITIFSVAVLLPIQYLADGELSGFNMLSFANIPERSHRAVANLVFCYVFTFGLFFVLYKLWNLNVATQSKWLANEQFCGRKLTVLVEGLPKAYRTDAALLKFFSTLFDRGVSGATVIKVTARLRALLVERDAAVNALNHAQGLRETDFGKGYPRQQHKLKMCCPAEADKVDAVAHFSHKVAEIDAKIAEAKRQSLEAATCGLVAFSSAAAAATASQVPLVSTFGRFTTRWAPEPREIHWDGMIMPPMRKHVMTVVMAVAHFFLVFFWAIPIGFISSLTSLESLSKVLPFLDDVVNLAPAIKGFLEGFLPALVMSIFMSILPIILAAMGRAQGIESESWVQMYVLKKYYVFQIFNFFLLTALASSVFKQMQEIIDDPTSIVTLLAQSIPTSATVFTSYVMLRAFMDNFLELAQVVRQLVCFLLGFISSTPDEFVGKWNPDPFKYGKMIPEALLVFTIGFCFSTIQPILVLFVAAFFLSGYLVHAYMFAFINVTVFETGGQFWPLTFNRMIVGVLISQLTMAGLFGLKKLPIEAAVMVPLIFITLFFWWYCDTNYAGKFYNPSVMEAVLTDKDRAMVSTTDKALLIAGRPVAPLGDDILPFLVPDRFADCEQRENTVMIMGLDAATEEAKVKNISDAKLTATDAAICGNPDRMRAKFNQSEKRYLAAAAAGSNENGDVDSDAEADAHDKKLAAQVAAAAAASQAEQKDEPVLVSSASIALAIAKAKADAEAQNKPPAAAGASGAVEGSAASAEAAGPEDPLTVPPSSSSVAPSPSAGKDKDAGKDGALDRVDSGVSDAAKERLEELRADFRRAAAAVAAARAKREEARATVRKNKIAHLEAAAANDAVAAAAAARAAKAAMRDARGLTPEAAHYGGAIRGEGEDEQMMARLALLRYNQPELAVARFGARAHARVWPQEYLSAQRERLATHKGVESVPYEEAVSAEERKEDLKAFNAADPTGRAMRSRGTDTDILNPSAKDNKGERDVDPDAVEAEAEAADAAAAEAEAEEKEDGGETSAPGAAVASASGATAAAKEADATNTIDPEAEAAADAAFEAETADYADEEAPAPAPAAAAAAAAEDSAAQGGDIEMQSMDKKADKSEGSDKDE